MTWHGLLSPVLKTDSTSEVATVATPERGPYPVQPFAPRAASGTWPTAENSWHKTAVVQLHLGCLAELNKRKPCPTWLTEGFLINHECQ